MTIIHTRRFGWLSRISLLASAVLLAAPAVPSLAAEREKKSGAATTATHTTVRDALSGLSADALEFHEHVTTLANPFFEGRSPGTAGNDRAADYIAFHFERLGLQPAFKDKDGAPTYFQPFSVPGEVEVSTAEVGYSGANGEVALAVESDFNPLGFSGNGAATGPIVFAGYSIDDGPNGFSSFGQHDSLNGAIVIILRFEPLDDDGRSKWAKIGNWSRHSSIMDKVKAAVSRGAAGIILVNPPGADDKRAKTLETPKTTRFGKPCGVPAVMLSNGAASKFIRAIDPEGRSLYDLRRLADAGGSVISFPAERTASLKIEMSRAALDTRNVAAILPAPQVDDLPIVDEFVIIGAHYDHLGYGYVGGSYPGNIGQIHPGADDNASGTAGLLILARRLKERDQEKDRGLKIRRSILFIAFSAEEMGLLGSEFFIHNSPIDSKRISAMINLDMVGRMEEGRIEVSGVGTAEGFEEFLKPLFDDSGLTVKTSIGGMGPSDHATFYGAGVPVLHFFTGVHTDYHQPGDLPSKTNAEGAAQAIFLIEDVAWALAERKETLAFKQTPGRRMGSVGSGGQRAKVRLGIMPGDYSGREPGVLVGEVFPDTSAAKSGVKKGDRIVRWGGEELADAGVMMQHLVNANPGDEVEIVVVRDGQEVTLKLVLLSNNRGN